MLHTFRRCLGRLLPTTPRRILGMGAGFAPRAGGSQTPGPLFCPMPRDDPAGAFRTPTARRPGRGEVPRLLARCPELCPEMAGLLREVSADLAARLGDGTTTGPWGEDYASEMRSAVEALRPLCDLVVADVGIGAASRS